MMNVIYKYKIPIATAFLFDVPRNSTFLSLQSQDGSIVAWYMVDPTQPMEFVHLRIYGTGHSIDESPSRLAFLGTVQVDDYVWHVFEEIV